MHAYFRPARTRYQRMTFRCMAGRSPDFCIDFIQRTIGSLAEKTLRRGLKRIEIGRCTIVVTFIGRFVEAESPTGASTGVFYEITREGTQEEFDAYFLERRAEVENIIRDLEAKHRG